MIEIKSIDLNEARIIIDAMVDYAAKNKPGIPMAHAVVDSAGVLVCFARMDGAAHAPRIMAENKARTVMHCKGLGDSGEIGKFVKKDFIFDLTCFVELGQMATVEGGIPIKDQNGMIIGAAAASGGLGPDDVEVVQAGLKAFDEYLKNRGE